MKLNLQNLNPFKKKDQQRDIDGKFTAGGGGLKAVKKFNWGRAAPVVVIVGLVGGYVVYQSFAGTALYRYQYSAYQCSDFNKDDIAKNSSDSCVVNSAEGMVYRMYQGAYGRSPDNSGLKFWTQKLAGDRDKPSEVAAAMLNTKAEASGLSNQDFIAKLYTVALNRAADPGGLAYWTGKLDGGSWTRERVMAHFANTGKVDYNVVNLKMTASDNQTFVEQLYSGMFNRQGDTAGVKYWTDQINLKKQGRNNVLAYFAISSEGLRAHGAGFANYLKDAPRVDVVPTAQKIRDERLWKAALNANAAKKAVDPVSERVSKARGNRDLARTIASKSKPTRSDLSQIAGQEKTVRAYLSRSNSVPSQTGKYLDQNRVWYVKSVDVAKWSPDLSADEIKGEYNKTVLYHELAKNGKKDLENLIRDIASSYKSAEGKYEAEQRRKAEEAARRAAEEAAARGGDGEGCEGPTYVMVEGSGCLRVSDLSYLGDSAAIIECANSGGVIGGGPGNVTCTPQTMPISDDEFKAPSHAYCQSGAYGNYYYSYNERFSKSNGDSVHRGTTGGRPFVNCYGQRGNSQRTTEGYFTSGLRTYCYPTDKYELKTYQTRGGTNYKTCRLK